MDDITAENMRLISTKKDTELEDILKSIKAAAENDKCCVWLYDKQLSTNTKLELESRGFRMSEGGRYNEIDTKVEW